MNVNETAQRHLKRDENPWYLCGQHFNAKVTWQPNNKSETGSTLFVSKFAICLSANRRLLMLLRCMPHAHVLCTCRSAPTPPSPVHDHARFTMSFSEKTEWVPFGRRVFSLFLGQHTDLSLSLAAFCKFAFSPFAGAARVPALVFSRRCARARRRRGQRSRVSVPCVREDLLHAHR